MNNLGSALGVSQLKRIRQTLMLKKNLNIFYQNYFKNSDEFSIFDYKNDQLKMNYWLNLILFNKSSSNFIDNLISELLKQKIYLRRLWNPLHTLPFLKNFERDNLDNTIRLSNTMLALPSSSFLINK